MPDVTDEQIATLNRWVRPTLERFAALRSRMKLRGFDDAHPLYVRVVIAHEAVAALADELLPQRNPKRLPPRKPQPPNVGENIPQWIKAMRAEDTSPY